MLRAVSPHRGPLQVVQTAALQQYPQLAGVVGDTGALEAFAADIENEANAYFQRAYAGEQPPPQPLARDGGA